MRVSFCLFVLGLSLGLTSAIQAQDAPFFQKTLPPINLNRGGTGASIDLTGLFGLENVSGPLATFELNVGTVTIELYPDVAPLTVANFLKYTTNLKYDATFLHRSIPNFVVQGGGYYYGSGGNYTPVEKFAPVHNEFALPNVHGTIAMAKIAGDLDSATSEWYFNNVDNSGPQGLDAPDQRFTVFGRLLASGVGLMDAINRQPRYNLNGTYPNGPFSDVPYVTFADTGDDFIKVEAVRAVPLLRLPATAPGYLTITATSSDPEAVAAEITSAGLQLTTGAKVGSARITVTGTDPAGQYAALTFLATSVNPSLPVVSLRALQATASEAGRAGVIRLQRTGSRKKRLVVYLDLGESTARYGADYPQFATSTIPAGKGSLDLFIRPKNDKAKEGLEKIVLTLVDRPAYTAAAERSATVSILDNDVPNVSMSVLQPTTTEKAGDAATVQFTRSGPVKTALSIPFALAGTARNGIDYTVPAGEATIPVGSASATISFSALTDTIHESTETIEITPTRATQYNILTPTATVSVVDAL